MSLNSQQHPFGQGWGQFTKTSPGPCWSSKMTLQDCLFVQIPGNTAGGRCFDAIINNRLPRLSLNRIVDSEPEGAIVKGRAVDCQLLGVLCCEDQTGRD